MSMPLRKPEGISWNAASIELPEIPTIQPGQDALSSTIAAVLPTLAAELTANVATLSAKENMFSGKLGAAQAAYQNSDDSGSQSVGQIVGMLGQVGQQAGQMGQMAGAPMQALGGQTGMFGSLMQQAMQGAHGGGAGGQSSGGAAGGAGAVGGAGVAGVVGQPQEREDAVPEQPAAQDQPTEHEERETPRHEEREPLHRADDRTLFGPSSDGQRGAAPVTPPAQPRGDDLGRRL
ncbi:hypothetical protein [Mycobacterium sp. MMS18-G62]